MSDIAEKEICRKHAPSTRRFLFRGGLILLAFGLAGIVYGQMMLDAPAGLTAGAQNQFKIGMGFFLGLQFSLVPVFALCLHYIFTLFQAERLAEGEEK